MHRAFLLAAVFSLALPAAAADLEPGKYRIIANVNGEKDDKPQEQCITQKDIDSGLTRIGIEKDNNACKIADFKRAPGAISYRGTCENGAYSLDAKGKLGGDTFELVMKMDIKGQPPMTMVIAGKRIGACSK